MPKKICFMILFFFILMIFPSYSLAGSPLLSYDESTDSFENPERGFYVPALLKLKESDSSVPESALKNNLTHLKVDISDFGGTGKKLSEGALDALDETLRLIKENGGTAVIRFAYDDYFSGSTVSEPDLKMMRTHIKQVSSVLERHEPVIACVEAGMLGLYGEYHGTGNCTKKNRTGIIQAWLDHLSSKLMISVRTPGYIAEWAGISLDKLCKDGTSKAGIERIGIYNDGYLGSSNDLGTYANRTNELDWLDEQTDSAFFGGEVVAYIDKGTPKNTAGYMEKEGFLTHTSYLNSLWNADVIDQLKKEVFDGKDSLYKGLSGYQYVDNHLGYRFVLTDSEITVAGDKLRIFLQIRNVGFGSLVNDKTATVILESADKVYELPFGDFDIRACKSQYKIGYTDYIPLEHIESGEYKVYLRISEYGDYTSDENYNCIRFANESSQWNEFFGANQAGSVEIPESTMREEIPDDSYVRTMQIEDLNQRFGTANGIRYKLSGSKAKIFKVENRKSITIPKSIVVNGKSYTVTGLNNSLFKDCSKVQTIKILNQTKKITSGTFSSCKKLKRITLSKSITKIAKGSLPDKSLKRIDYPGKKSQFDKLKLNWLHHVKVYTSNKTFTLNP
ncbi:MAG: DUF4832 domain-containing protein [Lachnospiraceae bacterium]|nr:DUF4832 domain-containing protein [Lachnospiraceae bacterium]